MIPVDRAILRRTAAIREAFRSVRTPDAIHVASTLERGCGSFLTGDRRLRGPADLEFINLLDFPGQEEASQ